MANKNVIARAPRQMSSRLHFVRCAERPTATNQEAATRNPLNKFGWHLWCQTSFWSCWWDDWRITILSDLKTPAIAQPSKSSTPLEPCKWQNRKSFTGCKSIIIHHISWPAGPNFGVECSGVAYCIPYSKCWNYMELHCELMQNIFKKISGTHTYIYISK